MSKNCAIILAAGEGKRMKADCPKALTEVVFKPMISWVLEAVKESGIDDICIVIGHLGDQMVDTLGPDYKYACQTERLGTGHAVKQALSFVKETDADNVLVLNGDAPFIDEITITESLKAHEETKSAVTVISARIENPLGYGRIVRDIYDQLVKIVEQKDATDEERLIKEVNSGAYWFTKDGLLYALDNMGCENKAGEYYLTDAVETLMSVGMRAFACMTDNNNVVLGANDRAQLLEINDIARREILRKHLINGVDIPCIDGVIISQEAVIGNSTTIYPNTIIKGKTVIGSDCTLGPNCLIEDSEIKDGVRLNNVQFENSVIEKGADIGPFSHVRPGSHIGEKVHIGNFVEIKNSNIGEATKVPHLTYVGDSDIGSRVNFGCGSLTVNYDGKIKSRTTVKDHAFIGCNTNLIAPVTVGEYSYTAAGSTITDDIPPYSLSIARARQQNKENWVAEKKPYKDMNGEK